MKHNSEFGERNKGKKEKMVLVRLTPWLYQSFKNYCFYYNMPMQEFLEKRIEDVVKSNRSIQSKEGAIFS